MPPIKGKMFSYSEDYMVKAYNEVKSGISISAAAKKYNIPYSTLSYKVHESRAAVTNEALSNWFSEISEFSKEKSLESVTRNPKRVFNCDETAFFLNPKGNKVLAVRGNKTVYQKVNADEKECLTVLLTGNAAGDLPPPMIESHGSLLVEVQMISIATIVMI
ncbi:hypothetical protein HW555_001927 [Spodoptera exigua]|uniref:HTH psq-type domain-containing protein n=1 Tax=Spodoptera exigua TaxID=7107 RepID=A0A835GN75_SPOEX|nr:hypothetical protein HW555_001927 [Spodoptera exigua]